MYVYLQGYETIPELILGLTRYFASTMKSVAKSNPGLAHRFAAGSAVYGVAGLTLGLWDVGNTFL